MVLNDYITMRDLICGLVGAVTIGIILACIYRVKRKEYNDLIDYWHELAAYKSARCMDLRHIYGFNETFLMPATWRRRYLHAMKIAMGSNDRYTTELWIKSLTDFNDMLTYIQTSKSVKFQFYITDGVYYLKDPLSDMVRVAPQMLSQVPPDYKAIQIFAASIRDGKLRLTDEDGNSFYPKDYNLCSYEREYRDLSKLWSDL